MGFENFIDVPFCYYSPYMIFFNVVSHFLRNNTEIGIGNSLNKVSICFKNIFN